MHVLVLPKWYPGRNDPQLGDFVRKQMLATSAVLNGRNDRLSVVFAVPIPGLEQLGIQELKTGDGAWELHCYYRPSSSRLLPVRKLVNLWRYWKAARNGIRRVIRERGNPDLVHVHILVRPALLAW